MSGVIKDEEVVLAHFICKIFEHLLDVLFTRECFIEFFDIVVLQNIFE